MEPHALDMLAALDAVNIPVCHLATHSTGGIIAARMLLMQPQRFGRVFALDPVTPLGMNTAAILIAYTFMIIYETARAKRKVAELISSLGSETEATNITAPITAAAANNIARNKKTLPKNTPRKKRASSRPSPPRHQPTNQ